MKRSLSLLPLGLVLASCGMIPIPPVSLPDMPVSVPGGFTAPSPYVFVNENVFTNVGPADSLSSFNLRANAFYTGSAGDRTIEVYLIKTRVVKDSNCTDLSAAMSNTFACTDLPAGAVTVFTGTLNADGTAVNFSSPTLDAAVKAHEGYFGMKFVSGDTTVNGDKIILKNVTVSAKL